MKAEAYEKGLRVERGVEEISQFLYDTALRGNLARSTFALDSSVSSRHLNEIGVPVRSAFAVR